MIVAIWAFENQYGGLHGIEHHRVVEVDGADIAEMYAIEESREVIENFCMDEIREYADAEADEGAFENGSDEYFQYIEDCIQDNIAYEIWEVVNCYDTIEQMQEDFYNNKEDFIEKYCRELV